MSPLLLACISLVSSTVASVIVAAYTVGVVRTRLDLLVAAHTSQIEGMQEQHAAGMRAIQDEAKQHERDDNRRFDAVSEQLFKLTGTAQRLIGQMEGMIYREQPRSGRRTSD